MYLIYLIYALTYLSVHCDIQRFQDGTFIADFNVINKGQMQYPSIVMFIEDLTLNECTEYCIKHLDCVTFNYNGYTRACELVDQDFDEFEALDDDPNWYNYGTPEKIDGSWSNWTSSSCSVTCGNGTITKYRTCTAPEPKYGGAPCIGREVQTVDCKEKPCPIDGGFSDWQDNGDCSVTCGGGTKNLIKTCTNPAPQHGGKDCPSSPKRPTKCNSQKCPCVRTTYGNCCKIPFTFDRKEYQDCFYHSGWKSYICQDSLGKTRMCAK